MYTHVLFWHGEDAILKEGYVFDRKYKKGRRYYLASPFFILIGGELTVRLRVNAESEVEKHVYRCPTSERVQAMAR